MAKSKTPPLKNAPSKKFKQKSGKRRGNKPLKANREGDRQPGAGGVAVAIPPQTPS